MRKINNRGAIELSIGTIVIIVLAMSMLILGLVLVKNIFSSANNAIDMTDAQLKDEINKLFTEDKKIVVYLPDQLAKIKQNENWGIGFGIKNLQKGTSEPGRFNYNVVVSDPDVRTKCGIGERDVENWIIAGRSDSTTLPPGEVFAGRVRFMIPDGAPICIVRFHIDVTKDNAPYATDFFDIEVLA